MCVRVCVSVCVRVCVCVCLCVHPNEPAFGCMAFLYTCAPLSLSQLSTVHLVCGVRVRVPTIYCASWVWRACGN